ncbi:phenylalanine--tRNA ligase subunit beta [Candidatus Pacearchaeota archaeon]|jgi:phenylalanyl-tRNA synthetase beta chain|nr:phenylalanine--tRNA ligase subunit beta [Candidatus Pacearchaeota archaeon]|tara:strand:+ start:4816 stop:6459 length:1644 start_codon:yes stop_codon:yes gene_type:complete
MAVINLNKKQFESEIGKLDEKMQNKVAMFGTPIEKIDNEDVEIEVFPNRPDLLSFQGFKRSFLAFLGKKTGLKKYNLNKPEKNYKVTIENSVKDVRPYTVCSIVKGLKLDNENIKELIEIQEKLHITVGRKRKKLAIGIYPLEKIKLPITYKALEPDKIRFIPLESNKKMSGLEILEKHPAGREYSQLLAGKTKFPIFIDANKDILSMPPIINSQLTGKITEDTKDVFIECSGFDKDILNKCLNIIITVLADMGGKVYQMNVIGKKREITPNLTTEKMKISIENTNKLLGLNLEKKQIRQLIEKMGHNYNKETVEIPSWRTDILHEVDLIEDIAIAYGYENFIPVIPEISTIGKENKKEIIKRKIAEILTGLNMLEVSNYHLTKKDDQNKKMGLSEKNKEKFIELEESKTEFSILRTNLTHYLLKIFSENIDSEYPQQIFEIGKVFKADKDIIEDENLAAAITPGNFTEIKQILEYLSKMINIKIEIKETEKSKAYFIEGRVAEILINNKKIGFIGEIHPKILKNWRIKMPIALFEINLKEVFKELD